MDLCNIQTVSVLKKEGYKVLTDSTLKTYKLQGCIDVIRYLENNWCVALERLENIQKIFVGNDATQTFPECDKLVITMDIYGDFQIDKCILKDDGSVVWLYETNKVKRWWDILDLLKVSVRNG